MTQTPHDSTAPASPKKSSVPVFVWILGGCGCVGFGCLPVLGILLAIALPSVLNQVGKARGSEAKSNLGTLNRAQQAYHLENNVFAKSIQDLDARVSGKFFTYQTEPSGNPNVVITTATPTKPDLKSYTGVAFILGSGQAANFASGICETDTASTTPPQLTSIPTSVAEPIECPPGSTLIP
jgi:type IV pilus assembly protein PilA